MVRIRNINSIYVFDSVARLGSVTKAAHVCGSTQSSVSYHIKKLETDLGVVLFRRTAHGLELTEEGARLAHHVDTGLRQISKGIEQVAQRHTVVRVALVPMFASRFVSAHISRLQQACPDVEVVLLNHNNSFVDFPDPRSFADFGIQWGRGSWSKFHAVKLWEERLVAVCSRITGRGWPLNSRLMCNAARCCMSMTSACGRNGWNAVARRCGRNSPA